MGVIVRASAAPAVRGVLTRMASRYVVGQEFSCASGETVPWNFVNDDFCDCEDGTDEPGTSACSMRVRGRKDWAFQCTNEGFFVQEVRHSRVNDGICDCCDGSDESSGIVECPNTCAKLAAEEMKAAKEREERRAAGLMARKDMVIAATSKRKELEERIATLRANLKESEAKLATAQEAKRVAEEQEVKEREVIRKKSEETVAEWHKEHDEKMRKKAEEEAAAKKLADAGQPAATATIPPPPAEEKPAETVCVKWRQTNNCKGNAERDPANDKDCKAQIFDGWSGYCECVVIANGVEKKYEKDCGHKVFSCDYVCEHNGEEPPTNLPAQPPVDEEKPPAVDDGHNHETEEAKTARRTFIDEDSRKKDLEHQLEDLQKIKDAQYGSDDAFFALYDRCFDKDDSQYTYSVCFFKEITQSAKSGGSRTTLGRWKGFGEQTYSLWGSKQDVSHMNFKEGDHCWNGPARSTDVHVVCGAETRVMSIEEPSMCTYKMVLETPGVCE